MAELKNGNRDEAILSLIHEKKEEGMKRLIECYFGELFQFTVRLTGNEEDAKDIIQVVLLDLWQFSQTDKIKNLRAYLFKMIKSRVFKLWADRNNITELLEKYNDILSDHQDPSGKIEFEEFSIEVERAVNQLPYSCRQIFELSKYDELSLDEIAEKLHLSKQTVKNQLTKANSILKNYLVSKDILI